MDLSTCARKHATPCVRWSLLALNEHAQSRVTFTFSPSASTCTATSCDRLGLGLICSSLSGPYLRPQCV